MEDNYKWRPTQSSIPEVLHCQRYIGIEPRGHCAFSAHLPDPAAIFLSLCGRSVFAMRACLPRINQIRSKADELLAVDTVRPAYTRQSMLQLRSLTYDASEMAAKRGRCPMFLTDVFDEKSMLRD